ncbi:hypothetical protein JX265_002319 [Neoarthrinium moseri]|uniref:BZIP domain-containing protein n=1 Tax=Neoarthrinium moseri TaxID=1658444 RepID=A0A9P9WUB5_9PEZI|nr:uncharacterized protein JN550_000131 [Neoarthrinium moseri]KAI1854680.1 hypothetical protein JX266_000798 [Neoarthrinium moseri]KAI1877949.1 hypothetical protein JN550_000131 [Neoarthrinium moseri]KAI1879365.1 hypothetical protein JX265_002319 [Neoarthrinium moseri]
MSIDQKEPSKESTPADSKVSTPDDEHSPSAPQEAQPAKRKGGRKPIYATSEERKQRNRQAQAAFRERRTEYIKQLEETIRVHESNLSNLQAAHRSAADECLMLRYKNSLLERILLEKGIDVQAELQAKTGSPNLGPTHMPQNMVQPPPIQRAILNRHHHSRRSASSIAPKMEPGAGSMPPSIHGLQTVTSPKSRPTPPSHANSPTNPNPGFGASAVSPNTSEAPNMRPGVPQPMRHLPPMQGPVAAAAARQQMMQHGQSAYSVSTEQEYDAPNDMIDDVEPETPGPGPYPTQFAGGQQPNMPMQPGTTGPPAQHAMAEEQESGQTSGQGYPSMTQLLDPALDWDPFGLSASMAFPTQFSFDTSSMR